MTCRIHFRLGLFIFLTPVLLWLLLLIVIPHIRTFAYVIARQEYTGEMVWTLANYRHFFTEQIYWYTFVRTASYAIIVTILTFLVTFPVAFYITKVVSPRLTGFLTILLLMPFWVSELVRVYGWMILLRESGVINHLLVSAGLDQRAGRDALQRYQYADGAGLHLHALYGGAFNLALLSQWTTA